MKFISNIRSAILIRKKRLLEDDEFLSSIILDNKTCEMQETLKLTGDDVLKKFFFAFRKAQKNNGTKEDQHRGRNRNRRKCHLSLDVVFREFIREDLDLNPFGVLVFELFVQDVKRVEFGELVYAICSFCLFELEEMVKLMWYKEDPEKLGHLFRSDVEDFMIILHGEEHMKKRNVNTAMVALRFKRDGSTTFRECCAWCKKFPCMMEPAFRIQTKLRLRFLGISYWEQKVLALKRERIMRSEMSLADLSLANPDSTKAIKS